ncbi:hypothetical protein [Pseudomonas sp.]|uniref:hypothetical protein n=1 Tax=Pseudomonas sp. TaxID=306 RepID=UPI0026355F13|nr:hypothetical protein [Pseudomonas sp.]
MLALSPSGELNTLAIMHFRHEFGHHLFVLANSQESRRTDKHRASDEHRGHLLGSQQLSYTKLASLLGQGAELYTTHLTDGFGWRDYQALHGERATLLFARDNSAWGHVVTPESDLKPVAGWTLLAVIQLARSRGALHKSQAQKSSP